MKLNIWKKNNLQIRVYINELLSGPYKETKIWFEQDENSIYPKLKVVGEYTIIAKNEDELKDFLLSKMGLNSKSTFKDVVAKGLN